MCAPKEVENLRIANPKHAKPTHLPNAPTLGTLFGGFEGVAVGALAAGIQPLWSVEKDPAAAEVARANLGHDVCVADILDCDPADFAAVDILHASPPCTNASVANVSGGESELDKRLAEKVIAFIATLRPRVFTLENVWAYRKFEAWQKIEDALHRAGYWVTADHVNAADYAVPQSRKRMIVRAVREGLVPYLPAPVPWVGWYEAIEDMIGTLPESQFAPWQLARLPDMLQTLLVAQGGFDGQLVAAVEGDPSFTITANHNQLGLKAFLVQVQGEGGDGVRLDTEPMQTVAANHGAAKYRAFLMAGGGNTNFGEAKPGHGCRYEDEPAHTVTAIGKEGGAMPRAFLVGDQERQLAVVGDPAFVVRAGETGGAAPRAWLVDGANARTDGRLIVREGDEPALTVTTGGTRHQLRSLLGAGRVVALTPRALARFQSFPDWYILPDNARLAAKGIGNAVPPLLMQRIYEGLSESLSA